MNKSTSQNFKLLMEQQGEESTQSWGVSSKPASMSMPFVALNIVVQTTDEYKAQPSVKMERHRLNQRGETENSCRSGELDNLQKHTISELRKLRREVALSLHPDRNPADSSAEFHELMSKANRRIDDAIAKHLDRNTKRRSK